MKQLFSVATVKCFEKVNEKKMNHLLFGVMMMNCFCGMADRGKVLNPYIKI